MIEIKKVEDKSQLKAFVMFPFQLYKGVKLWVPPLIDGEMNTFDPAKNPSLAFCDTCLFTAHQDGKMVARIALIINHRENEILKEKKMRIGWLDFIDDKQVSKAIFDAAESWASEQGMEYMEGPVGFCNLDKAALLTWGFDELSNTTALYNYPYYESHMIVNGFEYCTQWIEHEIIPPTEVPERIAHFSRLIQSKYSLSTPSLHSKEALRKYIPEVFEILNQTYSTLENFVPLTQAQQDFYARQFMTIINPDYVSCVLDKQGSMIAFSVAIPYMSKALQKANGKIFPFGWYHLLKAHKHNDRAELLLIGVKPEWQRKGVTAIMFEQVMLSVIKNKVRFVESNPEQTQNTQVQALWRDYNPRHHKSRWTFSKKIKK